MGSGGGKYDTGDHLDLASRLNQKSWLIDTGANIAAFASPQTGMHAYCTTSGSGFIAGEEYVYNGGWQHVHSMDSDVLVYPYSTTIGDYSTPVAVTVSGTDSSTTNLDQNGNGGNLSSNGLYGGTRRVCARFDSHGLGGRFLTQVTAELIKGAGSPAFDVICRVRRVSDDALLGSSTTIINASTLGGIPSDDVFNFDGVELPAGDFRICFENEDGSGGDTSNYVHWVRDTGESSSIGYASVYDGAAYSDDGTDRCRGNIVTSVDPPANAKDGLTTTKATTLSAVNPWLRAEMSASADKEPAAIALWIDASTTATQIKIQVSPDGSTWTDVRLINVSALANGAYNYIRFNRPTAQMRYIRIYGNDGSAKILSIVEIKFIAPTESQWNRRHGHKKILATEASIALAG